MRSRYASSFSSGARERGDQRHVSLPKVRLTNDRSCRPRTSTTDMVPPSQSGPYMK